MDGYVGIGRSKVICYMVVENSVGYSIIKEWISYEKWGIKECVWWWNGGGLIYIDVLVILVGYFVVWW